MWGRCQLLILLGLLVWLPRGPAADPGPVAGYLMDQKVSIFSFGMLRLGIELKQIQERLGIEGFLFPPTIGIATE
jgi:hypothetical protein